MVGRIAQLPKIEFLLSTDNCLDFGVIEEALDDEHVDHPGKAFLEGGELAFALLAELEVDVKSDELFDVGLCD